MTSPQHNTRWWFLCIPFALTIAAFAADHIGIDDRNSGFGITETAILAVAAIFLVVVVLDSKQYWTPRLLLTAVTTYFALVVWDVVVMTTASPHRVDPSIALKGLYVPDEEVGYKLASNWHGYWDDGVVRAEYQTNSKGHRDDEPETPSQQKVLLIGDSFAFGAVLDQSETIDKHIEQLTDGRIAAYNIGVGGAGPPMILEYFRRCSWFSGTDVIYLFYNNDLRDDNLMIDADTVVDGYLVPQFEAGTGRRYAANELRKKIASQLDVPRSDSSGPILRLYHLRTLLGTVLRTFRPTPLFQGNEAEFGADNILHAIAVTEKMRSLARDRDLSFHVVIVPSAGEATAKCYSKHTSGYVAELQARRFNTIELLGRVSDEHYFAHEWHFNPKGAAETARAIRKNLTAEPK